MTTRGIVRWFWRSSAPLFVPTIDDEDYCLYVVKDPTSRPTPVESWPVKAVSDLVGIKISWIVYSVGDPIQSSSWDSDSGINIISSDFSDDYARIAFDGGSSKTIYSFTNNVTLLSTATYSQTVKIYVDNKACSAPIAYGQGGASLANPCYTPVTYGPGGADLACP